jgi:hypothetical protein
MVQLIRHISSQDTGKLEAGRRVDDWFYTIGASRHVLLYEQDHFHAAADFLGALGLDAGSATIAHAVNAHDDLLAFVERAGLGKFLVDVKHVPLVADGKRTAKGFQIDVARVGPRELIQSHRMALIPRPGGKLRDTYELASLWLLWNLSAALAARRSTSNR